MKVTRKYETGTFENRNPSSAADYGISMDDQIKLKPCSTENESDSTRRIRKNWQIRSWTAEECLL